MTPGLSDVIQHNSKSQQGEEKKDNMSLIDDQILKTFEEAKQPPAELTEHTGQQITKTVRLLAREEAQEIPADQGQARLTE